MKNEIDTKKAIENFMKAIENLNQALISDLVIAATEGNFIRYMAPIKTKYHKWLDECLTKFGLSDDKEFYQEYLGRDYKRIISDVSTIPNGITKQKPCDDYFKWMQGRGGYAPQNYLYYGFDYIRGNLNYIELEPKEYIMDKSMELFLSGVKKPKNCDTNLQNHSGSSSKNYLPPAAKEQKISLDGHTKLKTKN